VIQSRQEDEAKVRQARDEALIHVRLREQGLEPDGPEMEALREALGPLAPFGTNHYLAVQVIVDWDHQIPSSYAIVRIYAAYSQHEARLLETQVRARDQAIEADNVYPEFDLPDYADMEASETYVGVWRPGATEWEDFRFFAPWSQEVKPVVARRRMIARARATSGSLAVVRVDWRWTTSMGARRMGSSGGG